MTACGCRPPYFPEWQNFSDCTFSEHASCISPNPGSHSSTWTIIRMSHAHAKVKKWIFNIEIPRNCFEFGIILNDFWSFSIWDTDSIWDIQIQVSLTGTEIPKNPGIQPKNEAESLLFSISPTVTKTVLSNANEIVMFAMLNTESTTSQFTEHWKNFPQQPETRILILLHFR